MESSLGMRDDKQTRVAMIDIEGSGEEPQGQMTKTRSYGDLMHAPDHAAHLHRRRSDPSISIEKYVICMRYVQMYPSDPSDEARNLLESHAYVLCHRKFDTLALESDADQKSAKNADDNKNQAANETLSETETRTKRCTVNQTSGDSPANPSVDSSTDTLIPNNDSVTPVTNREKEV